MPRAERAKIFMPFDALKGLQPALRAKEREVEAAALDERGGNDVEWAGASEDGAGFAAAGLDGVWPQSNEQGEDEGWTY